MTCSESRNATSTSEATDLSYVPTSLKTLTLLKDQTVHPLDSILDRWRQEDADALFSKTRAVVCVTTSGFT